MGSRFRKKKSGNLTQTQTYGSKPNIRRTHSHTSGAVTTAYSSSKNNHYKTTTKKFADGTTKRTRQTTWSAKKTKPMKATRPKSVKIRSTPIKSAKFKPTRSFARNNYSRRTSGSPLGTLIAIVVILFVVAYNYFAG